MDEQTQIRLERWFDGECDPAEAREIGQLLESDREARAHLAAIRAIRQGAGASYQSPARGADWSALEEKLDERATGRVTALPRFARLGGIAAIIILSGMAVWLPFRNASESPEADELMVNSVEIVETYIEDAMPVVYLDQPSGWTVVWVLEEGESGEI